MKEHALLSREISTHFPSSQPYGPLSGTSLSGGWVPWSPDPLLAYRWENPQASDELELFTLSPELVQIIEGKPLAHLSPDAGSLFFPAKIISTGSIMLDFGIECAAWLEFDSPDYPGGCSLSISEYNEPGIVNTGAENPVKTAAPVKVGEKTYRLVLNSELFEGVRFGWIQIHELHTPWQITAVRLVCQTKPVNYQGSFLTDNEMLNQVWYHCAYSVRLGLFKDYFGAILMDRSDRFSWTGDAYTAQAGALCAFANYDFIAQNLKNTATQANGIASYPLYFVLSYIDYCLYTGDQNIFQEYLEPSLLILNEATQHFQNTPNQCFYGSDERLGACFENASCPEAQRSYDLLCIRTFEQAANFFKQFSREDLYQSFHSRALASIDCLRKCPTWYHELGLFSASEAVCTGLLTQEEIAWLKKTVFSRRLERIAYSAFNHYHVLQAMAKLNMIDEALLSVDDLWGGQIRYGGTTTFECFHPSWADILKPNDPVPNGQTGYTSLCHPWGAGVIKWLHEHVAGITPLVPGFSSCEIRPNIGTRLNQLSISHPTPLGSLDLAVYFTSEQDYQGTMTLNVPTAMEVCLNDSTTIGIAPNQLRVLGQGKHTLSIYRKVEPGSFVIPPMEYQGTILLADTTTRGNWGGNYGTQGYILFGANHGHDIYYKPDYVQGIAISRWSNPIPTDFQTSTGVLAQSALNTGTRIWGGLSTANPLPTKQTFTIDVFLTEPQPYCLSIYAVDLFDQGIVQAIEFHHGRTMEFLTPVQLMKNFQDGMYIRMQFDDSVRIRINHVRGPNAILQGLFFDPPR